MSMEIRLPDFNALMALHQQDPAAFEEFRRHLLRDALDGAPPVHHAALEQLLARIEAARDNAATPMEAVLAASRMMQDSMGELLTTWEQARHAVAGLQAATILQRLRQ
ncbi:DUF3135 domain-containing protein [Noviherbaspirillum cavernae]|uniref:DUF3135 domain-containing protein n=1 Tax=Noviherbaspirillum cavernae TaxID=2320862 RepID=A0A418WX87_9BURK|nr:DUF3135 domain-containing protein [Noviherbaspirillum cavernae]RJG04705.1 DUF3135 domain-containing protein [Noviherbaspirillum cavernae]